MPVALPVIVNAPPPIVRVLVEGSILVGVDIFDIFSVSVPPLTTRPPVKVLAVALFKVSAPGPYLVRLYPVPEIAPPTVSVFAPITVTMRLALMLTRPLPKVRL